MIIRIRMVILLVIVFPLDSQNNPNIIWEFFYGNNIDNERLWKVDKSNNEGYISVGTLDYTVGDITFTDILLLHLDSLGNQDWVSQCGDSISFETARDVFQFGDDSFAIFGNISYGSGNRDYYLLKTNPAGGIIWSHSYTQNNNDIGYSMAETYNNGIIMVGGTQFSNGKFGANIVMVDSTGIVVWENIFWGPDSAFSWVIAKDVIVTDDGYLICGNRSMTYGAGNDDIFILKLNNAGEQDWVQFYNIPSATSVSGDLRVFNMKRTNDSGYILLGGTGNNDLDQNNWLMKIDSNFYVSWRRDFVEEFEFTDVIITDEGYLLAGNHNGEINSSGLLLEVNGLGNFIWDQIYQVDDFRKILSVIQDDSDNFVFQGLTEELGQYPYNWDSWFVKTGRPYHEIELIQMENDTVSEGTINPLYNIAANYNYNLPLAYDSYSDTTAVITTTNSSLLSVFISEDWFGNSIITVIASAVEGTSDSTSFSIVVQNVNDPPQNFVLIFPTITDTFSTNEACDSSITCTWSPSNDIDSELDYKLTIELNFYNTVYSDIHENIIDTVYEISSHSLDILLNALSLDHSIISWYVESYDGEYYAYSDTGHFFLTRSILNSKNNVITPQRFLIHQNFPNPFNPSTNIYYELPKRTEVQITIYDLLGRKVTTLVSETQEAGYKSVSWDATNVSSGMYFYQIRAGDFVETKKMVLLR